MEGLNYEFICHHPAPTMERLATDLSVFLMKEEELHEVDDNIVPPSSPRATVDYSKEYSDELLERAFEIERRSLIFSDVSFLFAPNEIAYAIMALVLRSVNADGCVGDTMRAFLKEHVAGAEQARMIENVNRIVRMLWKSPLMDLNKPDGTHGREIVTKRAEELREVLGKVANIRLLRSMYQPRAPLSRKRNRSVAEHEPVHYHHARKVFRVSPMWGH